MYACIYTHPTARDGSLVRDPEIRKGANSFFGIQPWSQGRTEGCSVAGVCHGIRITRYDSAFAGKAIQMPLTGKPLLRRVGAVKKRHSDAEH